MTSQAARARAGSKVSAGRRLRFITATALATGMLGGWAAPALAGEVVYVNPPDVEANWEDGASWDVNVAPQNASDKAVFNTGHRVVYNTSGSVIEGIRYDIGADSGTITVNGLLALTGSGILNDSLNLQTIRVVGDGAHQLAFGGTADVLGSTVAIEVGDTALVHFGDQSDGTFGDFYVGQDAFVRSAVSDGTLTLGAISGTGGLVATSQFGGAATHTVSIGALNTSTTFQGVIDELEPVLTIEKIGTGTLTLTGNNTYSGGTIVSGGFVGFTTGENLGTGNVTLDGGGLQWEMGNALDISSRLNPLGVNGGTFDTNGNNVTLASVIGGSGSLGKTGAGILTLTAVNTFTGGTYVNGGLINFSSKDNFGTGTITLAGGGLQWATGSTVDISDRLGPLGYATFDTNGNDVTFANDITGAGSLTKLGAGTLTLTGFNDYAGTTAILGGTLEDGGAGLFGTGLVEIDNGATLRALDDLGLFADVSIGAGGGTIDTGDFFVDVFGSVEFGGELTKTGSGVLLLEDGSGTTDGDGGINVVAGTLALGSGYAAGTGPIRLADGTWLSNGSCLCGSLSIDNDIEIAAGGTATLNGQGGYIALNGVISGGSATFVADDGQSSEINSAIFLLNGLNTYDRTMIGPNVAVVLLDGTLGTGDTTFDPAPSNPFTPSALIFANSTDYDYGGAIIGSGLISVETFDPATVISLSGSNTTGKNYTGTIELSSGHLKIEGDVGDIDNDSALLSVIGCFCSDATLGGSGTFHGSVDIDTGTLAPGSSPGTLAIAADLTLGVGSILNYELGQPGVVGAAINDLVTVGGTLTLGGTLNTIDFGPSYGPGYYRLFNYGTLVDNGLTIGSIAGGLSTELLFNVSGQVNLRLGPQVALYWDGGDTTGASTAAGGDGGAGTWNAAGTNWTAGTGFGINDRWRSAVGVFAGSAAGTVTVVGTQTFEGLRFETDGYLLRPFDASARLATTGAASTVDVGAGLAADIGVIIDGASGLTKTGAGTLLLSAVNTFAGATTVSGGTLRLGTDNAISNQSALVIAGGATFDLDGFQTSTGSLSGQGAVTLGGGRLDTGYDDSATVFDGTVAGDGTFTKNGSGTLTLAGSIDLPLTPGGTNLVLINTGTLDVTGTGSLSADVVQNFATVVNAGTITGGQTFQNFGVLTNTGTIVGFTQNFATLDNNGGTMGSLQSLGTATNSGTINGTVQSFASFTSTGIINGSLGNYGTALVQGEINGELANLTGGATITLTGVTTGITSYQGSAGSTLDLASFSTTIGGLTGTGSILLGTGTLTLSGLAPALAFNGDISGSGALVKTGTGEQILNGANTYSGLTTVSNGTLTVGLGGSLAGSVENYAAFVNNGLVSGGVVNSGTFTTTGTVDGGVVNQATMLASGQSNGTFLNFGTVTLTGTLTGVTGFDQDALAQLDLAGFDLTTGSLSGAGSISLGGGTLTTGGSNASTSFAGPISGSGGLTKVGTGTLILANDNSYSGTTTISGGTLQVGTGGAEGSLGSSNVVNGAALVIDRTGLMTIEGVVTGSGSITKFGAGTLEFAGDNTPGNDFTGSIQVSAGSLLLNGTLGDTAGNTAQLTMDAGTSFGGTGSFLGSATVNGTLAAGNSPGTLTIAGNLTLGAGTILDYELGEAGTPGGANNDLVVVGGDLTLDGTLNTVAFGPGYQPGYYRLFDYGGALTDNGLAIGTIDGALSASVLTNIAGQVNVVLGPQLIQYWDDGDMTGASAGVNGDGGNGTWNASNTNWTAAAGFGINDQWRSHIGVFAGTGGGAVSIEGTQAFQELRFTTDGYVLEGAAAGDGLATTGGFSVIDVTVGLDAVIGATISGAAGLTKTGFGTLTLGGANSYTGETTVSTGILAVTATGSLAGAVVNNAAFDNAGTVAGLVTNNSVLVSTGTLAGGLANSGTANLAGQVLGAVANSGSLNLTGATTGIGAFTQTATGTFALNGFDTILGSLAGAGQVALGGAALTAGGDNGSTAFSGAISGSGSFTKAGTGTLTLSGDSSVSIGIDDGTLILTGTVDGGIVNRGNFISTGIVNGNLENIVGTVSLQGQLNGAIDNSAGIALTGTTTGIGAVVQSALATFALNGFDTTFGSLSGPGALDLGSATLTTNGDGSSTTMSGVIAGTGGLTKIGSGELTLSGGNIFTGLTTVSDGVLSLSLGGSLAGDVLNNATFSTSGNITGNLTNNGAVFAEGVLNGSIVNEGSISLAGYLHGVRDFTQGVEGSLALNGNTFSIETLAGAGTIDLGGGGLYTDSGGNSLFNGSLVGPGTLSKDGGGTLTFGGDSTAGFVIFGGTLILTGSTTRDVVNSANFANDGIVGGILLNHVGGTAVNAGTVESVNNYGALTSSGTVNNGLVNQGGASVLSTGAIAGEIFNATGGAFTSTGTINGNLENHGSASIEGQLNGGVVNVGDVVLTGTTAGIGAVAQTAAGVFALHGFDTAIGSLAGTGQVQLGTAVLTTGSDDTSTTFSGVISGVGGLTKVGTGTLTLSGVNAYSGNTRVTAGGLVNSGSLGGSVINLATFASTGTVAGSLVNSGTASLAGQLDGPIANSGVVGLTGLTTGIGAVTQTAAGAFVLNDFVTTIGSLGGAGQVQLGRATLTTGGDGSSTAFAGVVSGTGALTKVGTGTLVLGGANTFTGVTTITGGTLQLGDGGTAGSLASSSIVDNGVLTINRSDLLQISAVISGSGGFIQAGSGTTQLTGANSYTGGTLVSAGRLVGTTGSLQGPIRNDAVLEFAQAGAGTYAGSLSGTGAFEKTGVGLLNLTGDSSAFTGVTRVLGGQLAVNGLLGRSVVTVGPGATLMGVGPIGGLVAQSGSTVAPGNSVGTLQVDGNVQLLGGSTYQAEVTAAAADLINATGTAQIAGTLSVINLGGTYTLGSTYVIVNAAAGRTGTFDATSGLNSFGPRLRARVVYTPTQVQLLMAPNSLADLACNGPARNEASFMAAFDDAVQNGGYDPQALGAVYDLDPAGVCRAAGQLAGGVYPALASVALEEERLVREAAVDRLRFAQDAEAVGTGAWAQLVGSWGHVNSDGMGFDVDHNREGVIFGVDTGGVGWRVGIYGHHIETELDADALASEAHLERNGAGAYAGFASGSFRARVGASYSDLGFGTSRAVAFPGFSASTRGEGDGSMVQGFAEVAYRFVIDDETSLEPFTDLALASVDLDAVEETGAAAAQLRVTGQEHDVGRAIAGLRGDAAIHSGSTRLRLGIDAGLQHNFGDRSIAALVALDGAPQHPFTVRATEIEPWAFVGGGRVAIDFGSNVTATLSYRGVLAGNRNDHAAAGTLGVRF